MISTDQTVAKDFEVFVRTTSGRRLEYPCVIKEEEKNPNEQVVWLQCPDNDETFEVVIKSPARRSAWGAKLHIDGKCIDGRWCDISSKSFLMVLDNMAVEKPDGHYDYKLAFSALVTTDDNSIACRGASIDQLGELSLLIYEGWTERRRDIEYTPQAEDAQSHGLRTKASKHCAQVVDEKLKKEVDRSVSGVQGVKLRSKAVSGLFFRADSKRPPYKFTFKYASKALLQAKGIIPPPPLTEIEVEVQRLRQEIKDLRARKASEARRAHRLDSKDEKIRLDSPGTSGQKRKWQDDEIIDVTSETQRKRPVEVIDLTLDDEE